jgi:hypothetical protein
MPLSQFTRAIFDDDGNIQVNGPFELSPSETGLTVTNLHFLLTQGGEFASGTGNVDGTAWDGTAELANNLTAGEPTQAIGFAVLFGAVDADGEQPGPQTYSWSHPVNLEPPA